MTISRITAKTRTPHHQPAKQTEQQCMQQPIGISPRNFYHSHFTISKSIGLLILSPIGKDCEPGVVERFSSSTSRGSMVKVDRNSGRFNVPELKVSKSNRTLRYSCSPIHLEQVYTPLYMRKAPCPSMLHTCWQGFP